MTATTDEQAIDRLGRVELLLTVLVIQAAVLGVVSLSPNSTVPFDMTVYADLAGRVFDGALPYRDVSLEYPPLSLVAILSPRLLEVVSPIGGYAGYQASFLLLMGALSLALTALIWLMARRSLTALDPLRPLLYALLLVALASPLMLWRFDLLPAILTLLALLWTLTGRPVLGGAALALAIAAKLYPAVLVPVFIAAYLATSDRRALGSFLAGVVGVGLVLLLGTLLIAPESVANVLGYSLDRGVQLESTFAGWMELGHLAGVASATVSDQFNSLQVDTSWSGLVRLVQPVILIVLVVAVWWLAWRSFRRQVDTSGQLSLNSLIGFLIAALLAFMLGSRVFSPQYMIWLIPFAPFLPRTTFAAVAVAFALTFLIFPYLYSGLIGLEVVPVLLLNLRNLVLIGVLIVLGLEGSRAAGSSEPAPP